MSALSFSPVNNTDVFSKPFHGFFSSQVPANQHHHCIRVLTNTASRLRAFSCSPWSPLNRTSQANDLAREDLRSETPKYHCLLLLMYETFPEFSNPPKKTEFFFWIDAIYLGFSLRPPWQCSNSNLHWTPIEREGSVVSNATWQGLVRMHQG